MLRQRIITAIVLLAFLLPAVFYPDSTAFMGMTIVLIAAGAWEWSNLNQCKPLTAYGVGALCAAGCLVAWYFGFALLPYRGLWLTAGVVWVLSGVWLLRGGVEVWARVPQIVRVVIGVLALWLAWLAVVQARAAGINFLVSTMVLVWIADVFAYFSGRALGGRFIKAKLAPTISPGKTWEGVLGGMIGVLVTAGVWRLADASSGTDDLSVFSRLGQYGLLFMFISVAFLAAMSVVGDLVESLFKRSAGFKDSSGLLPGHGGVLDRLDALLPVLPLAMMLTSI
ncbi:MAG: phosphatidate cytidylyltransferase [Candidatus Saccharibacteria bacterium]|nr:phosphatidate cytidylyltransferase [Rhodoferax sp.]